MKHVILKAPFSGAEWQYDADGYSAVSNTTGERWSYDRKLSLWRWACSNEQWQAVRATIPRMIPNPDLIRERYNNAASDYLALVFYYDDRPMKGSKAAKLWRARRKALSKLMPDKDEPATLLYRDRLAALEQMMDIYIKAFEMQREAHRGKRRPERDKLHADLLEIWYLDLSQKFTTRRSHSDRVPNSPIVTFLLAALVPILRKKMIQAEAAEEIVERERNNLKWRQQPENHEHVVKFLTSAAMTKPRRPAR